MDENRSSAVLTDILIVSVSLVLTDLIGNLAHLTFLPWYKPVPSFITTLAVVFISTRYAKSDPGRYGFGNIFGYAMKVSACSAIIVAIYTYLSFKFFYPGLKEIALDQVRVELSKKDDLPPGTMDTALSITQRMFIPLAVFGSMISTMLIAVIGGLISYFFSKPFLKTSGY